MNRLLKACLGHEVDRTPVWLMRQAGRYLPDYQAIRQEHSFVEMVHNPELAAEVTLQPVNIFGVDAAIIFSDILVVPEALGQSFEIVESQGPQMAFTFRSKDDFDRCRPFHTTEDAGSRLYYVMEALKKTRAKLKPDKALIGFSGAPWTLMTYMIEGGPSKDFAHAKQILFEENWGQDLLVVLQEAVSAYLKIQAVAGADVVQIFDSWAGGLPAQVYYEKCLPGLKAIIHDFKTDFPDKGVILFARGREDLLPELCATGADALSLSWSCDPWRAVTAVQGRVTLQGNLDPAILKMSPNTIKREVKAMKKGFRGARNHICNLGHGITPDVPPEHVKIFVEACQE